MPRITLPSSSRAHLYSFWLVQSACAAFLVAIAGTAAGVHHSAQMGIVFGVLIGLAVFRWPGMASSSYEKWDRWAAAYASRASKLLMGICYVAIFMPAAWAGSRMRRDRTSRSMWTSRATTAADAYVSQSDLPLAADSRGWVRAYVQWASKSGNLWAVSLLPYLILIAALDPERSQKYPGNIYTLF